MRGVWCVVRDELFFTDEDANNVPLASFIFHPSSFILHPFLQGVRGDLNPPPRRSQRRVSTTYTTDTVLRPGLEPGTPR